MEKNMDQANIILKMEIFMMVKCTKEKCKVKENIHGRTRIFIKVLLKAYFC